MTFVQSTTGSGGWPLNVFLTPDLKPFFGGTYFPPDSASWPAGFFAIARADRRSSGANGKTEIVASADELARAAGTHHRARRERRFSADAGDAAARRRNVQGSLDPANGGFGGAPKFPQPGIPSLLLRAAKRFRRRRGGEHGPAHLRPDGRRRHPRPARRRFRALRRGCRSGWCRISRRCSMTTRNWRSFISTRFSSAATRRGTPESRARHSGLCLARHDASGRRILFRRGCRQRRPRGKILLLDAGRISRLLTPEEFNVAAKYFGITAEGNFVDHSHPHAVAGPKCVERRWIPTSTLAAEDGTAARLAPKQKCSRRAPTASARIWTTKFSLRGTA